MHTVNIHEAKTNLSRLIENAIQNDQSFIIAKSGKPLVKVEPIKSEKKKVIFGLMKGKIKISKDFDEPNQEIIDMFEGFAK